MEEPVIDGYTIQGKLGSGGMSTVFLAEQTKFKRKVALKVMSGHLSANPDFKARFIREAQIVASLTHPGIVPVHDLGTTDTSSYMAMEYLPGPDFKARLKNKMRIADGLRVLANISDALGYAHSKQVIHRDLKPANILFREDGSPVLVDFGIARNMETSTQLTVAGTVMGTPHYMSPEQCSGEPIDFRSDLYSLGIMLFELIADRLPYDADNSAAMSFKHVQAPIPTLSDDLALYQATINKALAKRPDQRFQSASEFGAAIRALEDRLPETDKMTDVLTSSSIPTPPIAGVQCIAPKIKSKARRYHTTWIGGAAVVFSALVIAMYFVGNQATETSVAGEATVEPIDAEGSAAQLEATAQRSPENQKGNLNPAASGAVELTEAESRPGETVTSEIAQSTQDLLVRAKLDVWNGKMITPSGDNAYEKLVRILADEPNLEEALELKERILNTLAAEAELQIENRDWDAVQSSIQSLKVVGADSRAQLLQEKLALAQSP